MSENHDKKFELEPEPEEGDDLNHLTEEERTVLIERVQYSIYEIYRRYNRGDIILKPFYQRNAVWNNSKKSKLIESVIRNIPIPSIYFAEQGDGKWEVVDGQQRLRAFFEFFKGDFKLSALPVLSQLIKLDFDNLDTSQQRKIEDYQLHIFIIKKNSHPDIRFDIFERINEGATQLNAQELRNSMYRDGQNELLKKLSKDPGFIKLTKGKISDKRLKDQEAILRFLSFWKKGYDRYGGNMNSYLNNTMDQFFEYFPKKDELTTQQTFKKTMELIDRVLGADAFIKNGASRMNMSLFDVITFSFATLPSEAIIANSTAIKEMYTELMLNNDEFIKTISSNTLAKNTVQSRFNIWMDCMNHIIGEG